MRRVGHGLADLLGDLVHRPLALRQHIRDLGPAAAGQRLGHLGEACVERVLGRSITHAGHRLPRPVLCQVLKRLLDKTGGGRDHSLVRTAAPVRLGLRANLAQFSRLVGVNALVGGMIGQERTVLPLLAERVFHLTAYTAALTFILAFGTVKVITNFAAGTLSDRIGRKPVLVAGWLVGVPVPLLIMWAPSWGWIIVANVLLGINQGLTWSTTVIMKIDLAGPDRRGLAMGLNEAAGYGAVAITALATGAIAAHAGLRPEPFYLGVAYAGLGVGLSTLFVRETRGHARHEAARHT